MENWFEIKTADEPLMLGLSQDEKKHKLFLDQKATLDMFLERGAISRKQYDKSLNDLRVKMGEKE